MRTLWIAGLGAVLVAGGVSAQSMNSAPVGQGGTPNERALTRSPADEPDSMRRAQAPMRQSADNMPRRGSGSGGVDTIHRENAPRDPASRAYMGGGMILENGRPVPLPGDPPNAAADFRGGNVGQSTGRGMPGQAGMSDPSRPNGPQTNVGQTGAGDQGAVGSAMGAFPANPPSGRVPVGGN